MRWGKKLVGGANVEDSNQKLGFHDARRRGRRDKKKWGARLFFGIKSKTAVKSHGRSRNRAGMFLKCRNHWWVKVSGTNPKPSSVNSKKKQVVALYKAADVRQVAHPRKGY